MIFSSLAEMTLINEIDGAGLEYRAMARLEELLGRVPFIRLSPRKRSSRSDGTIEAEVAGRRWLILVETRKLGQPREVRSALLRLQSQLEKADAKHRYGVFVSPFISEESARLCVEAGAGYADLAGNARLSFDHVFIETHAADNPFRVKRHLRSLFSAKAGRLLRVLLTPPLRPWRVTELAASAGVSLGQVSNVRKLLLDREWAVVGDGGLSLSRPEDLALAWQKSYELRPRSRSGAYTLLHGDALQDATRRALALDLSVAGERGAEAAEHLLNERLLPAWKAASP